MSNGIQTSDAARWNARYADGAYADREHPSVALKQWLERQPTVSNKSRMAADLACGRGRNSRYLAQHGWQVEGYDVSAVGLELAAAATDRAAPVTWIERDLLQTGLPEECRFDLIIAMRFYAPALFPCLSQHMHPGATVIVECHLQTEQNGVGGPGSNRFRARPKECISWFPDLQIEEHFEGITVDPDGTPMALARVIAHKP